MAQEIGPEQTDKKDRRSLLIVLAITIAAGVYLGKDPARLVNIALMLMGFGAVVFVHEFGHFAAAKAVGIKVEGFSIGFGPILLGIKRVSDGLRLRLLPGLIGGKDQAGLAVVLGAGSGVEADTEYCVRLIPLGGFVKMLGQEDLTADAGSNDPRAFTNKSVWRRAVVIAAGVTMNIIVGTVAFMVIFAHGIEQEPAIVGDVMPESPAAQVGLVPGDEVIAINGKENARFIDLKVASMLGDKNEIVHLKVRRLDGAVEDIDVELAFNAETQQNYIGVTSAPSLTIAKPAEDEYLRKFQEAGFVPGSKIVAVNGQAIVRWKQLFGALFGEPGQLGSESVTLTIEGPGADGQVARHDVQVTRKLAPAGEKPEQLLGMVPRVKVQEVFMDSARQAGLRAGDVIVRAGAVLGNPTFSELQDFCTSNINESVGLVVERNQDGQAVREELTIRPQAAEQSWLKRLFAESEAQALIGFLREYDLDSAVVAQSISAQAGDDTDQPAVVPVPRGATITAIGGTAVADWQDMLEQLVHNKGRQVEIAYRSEGEQAAQTLTVAVPDDDAWIGFSYQPDWGELGGLPLESMTKLYKAATFAESLSMGIDSAVGFIQQTGLTLKALFRRVVSPKELMGPVGILGLTYTIAKERAAVEYCYFLAMVSTLIAVFNLLPLPILDGGHLLLLLIEKIKGSPVSIKIQEVTTYAGMILLGGLVLYVTFHDIGRLVNGF